MKRSHLFAVLLALAPLAGACDNVTTPIDPIDAGRPDLPEQPGEPMEPEPTTGTPYVVLLSLDGFRPDYFLERATTHMARVAQRGVRAAGLEPVFPTLTFPNHLSQVTGLYPDRHGIVSNTFYDPARGAWYSLSNGATRDGSWYRGEPIWATAERQNVRTASFFWPGSDAEIASRRPSMWKPYNGVVPNAERVDSVLAWLRLEPARRPHLVTLYMSDVDSEGHRVGPDGASIQNAITAVDLALGRLIDGLDALPQRDSVFLVIVSDHGMARYEASQSESFESYADMRGVIVGTAGPYANLHVPAGDTAAIRLRDQLDAGLQHGRAYLRDDVPAALHHRSDPRVGDVVVVMEAPWQIRSGSLFAGGGHHGWPADEDMYGILMVYGPGIPAGKTIGRVRAIDLHPFLAELLGIEPAAGIDGTSGAIRAVIGS